MYVAVYKYDDNNDFGIFFRATDLTAGSEDGYWIRTSGEYWYLYDVAAGSSSTIGSATLGLNARYPCWTYFGVFAVGSQIACFFSLNKADLFATYNRQINVSDSTHSGGIFGLHPRGADVAMFADFHLEEIADLHVAEDNLGSFTVNCAFRSIVPFHES
jgi:hypothetical protein